MADADDASISEICYCESTFLDEICRVSSSYRGDTASPGSHPFDALIAQGDEFIIADDISSGLLINADRRFIAALAEAIAADICLSSKGHGRRTRSLALIDGAVRAPSIVASTPQMTLLKSVANHGEDDGLGDGDGDGEGSGCAVDERSSCQVMDS